MRRRYLIPTLCLSVLTLPTPAAAAAPQLQCGSPFHIDVDSYWEGEVCGVGGVATLVANSSAPIQVAGACFGVSEEPPHAVRCSVPGHGCRRVSITPHDGGAAAVDAVVECCEECTMGGYAAGLLDPRFSSEREAEGLLGELSRWVTLEAVGAGALIESLARRPSFVAVPEMEDGDWYAVMTETERAALRSYVGAGGALLVAGSNRFWRNSDLSLLNGLFGTALHHDGLSCETRGAGAQLDTVAAAGTVFAGSPRLLPHANAVYCLQPLRPGSNFQPMYSDDAGRVWAGLLRRGAGSVVWLGFDWWERPLPVEWRAVLQQVANGLVLGGPSTSSPTVATQSPIMRSDPSAAAASEHDIQISFPAIRAAFPVGLRVANPVAPWEVSSLPTSTRDGDGSVGVQLTVTLSLMLLREDIPAWKDGFTSSVALFLKMKPSRVENVAVTRQSVTVQRRQHPLGYEGLVLVSFRICPRYGCLRNDGGGSGMEDWALALVICVLVGFGLAMVVCGIMCLRSRDGKELDSEEENGKEEEINEPYGFEFDPKAEPVTPTPSEVPPEPPIGTPQAQVREHFMETEKGWPSIVPIDTGEAQPPAPPPSVLGSARFTETSPSSWRGGSARWCSPQHTECGNSVVGHVSIQRERSPTPPPIPLRKVPPRPSPGFHSRSGLAPSPGLQPSIPPPRHTWTPHGSPQQPLAPPPTVTERLSAPPCESPTWRGSPDLHGPFTTPVSNSPPHRRTGVPFSPPGPLVLFPVQCCPTPGSARLTTASPTASRASRCDRPGSARPSAASPVASQGGSARGGTGTDRG
eukprot:Hpha_TRINITY_DN14885_c0_g1::TRINITY_DN14885_c0_g1_i1::g.170393::m.170393